MTSTANNAASAAVPVASQVQPKLKDYVFTEKLGSGTYGDVYKVYKKVGSRDVFAVKCVLRGKLRKCEIDSIVSEISLLKKLKHPNIVTMVDFDWDASYIYIVMEYCGQGDLSRYIRKHRVLPEPVCRQFMQQLAFALQFLRSQNIAHMDLKPQNILLQGRTLKLADFGFAQHFSDDQIKTSIRGSPLYMAPEMVLERKYDAKVDLWSVGVILYECLFGKAPYKSESLDELLQKIRAETPIVIPRNYKISELCRDILMKCLQRDPSRRIDYDEFFQHPFLDLEHSPSESSMEKAKLLIDQAVICDNNGDVEEALQLYRSALEYLVPLVDWEKNATRKASIKQKIDQYLTRAEEIKRILRGGSSSMEAPTSLRYVEYLGEVAAPNSTSVGNGEKANNGASKLDELMRLSSATPALKTALEIGQSAEFYEREAQYTTAMERYEKSLSLLLPLLTNEPKGLRKTLLAAQVNRWMSRAEAVKELMAIQNKALADCEADSVSDKQCSIQ